MGKETIEIIFTVITVSIYVVFFIVAFTLIVMLLFPGNSKNEEDTYFEMCRKERDEKLCYLYESVYIINLRRYEKHFKVDVERRHFSDYKLYYRECQRLRDAIQKNEPINFN